MPSNDTERLIEKYREELMRFAKNAKGTSSAQRSANRQGGANAPQNMQNTRASGAAGANVAQNTPQNTVEKQSPSSGTENDEGAELRGFDDGFMALEDLRDRAVGGATDFDQSDPINRQALGRADFDYESDDFVENSHIMREMSKTDGDVLLAENGHTHNVDNGHISDAADRRLYSAVIMGNAFGEADSEDTPAPILTDNIAGNEGDSSSRFFGTLEVTARTGSDALPVEEVLIIVTSSVNGEGRLEQVGMTDKSGKARIFNLPAANPENTQSPDMANQYFLYDVAASKPGYYDLLSKGVPLFGGVVSQQNFNMVPLPEGLPQENIVNQNTEPNRPQDSRDLADGMGSMFDRDGEA